MAVTATEPELESSSYCNPAPRWATRRNPLRPSYGPAVVTAAALMGLELMPWQVYVLLVALEVQSEAAGDEAPGEWAYDEVGVSTPRQSGKTVLLRPLVAHTLAGGKRRRVWSTAQTGVHARRRWLDLTDALKDSPVEPKFRRKTGAGHEELRWTDTESTLEPFAPNGESLHGETPDKVLVDELWAFDAEQARELRQAYLPGFTTKDAQAWLLSTAGDERSAWLNSLRKRGRRAVEEGRQRGLAWFEWTLPDAVDGIPVEELPDEDLVELCIRMHPAYGYTLRPASLRSAFETMTEEDYAAGRADFIRAYGNRSQTDHGARVIPAVTWAAAGTDERIPDGARLCLAFEVDPDDEESSLSIGLRHPDGWALVERIDTREGSRWVAPRVIELREKWSDIASVACNDAGPSRDVADLLEEAGVDVFRINTRDYAAACVRYDAELRNKVEDEAGRKRPAPTVLHRRGDEILDEACKEVRKRKLSGAFAWAKAPGGAPVTGFTSATIALWGIDHAPVVEPESGFWMG